MPGANKKQEENAKAVRKWDPDGFSVRFCKVHRKGAAFIMKVEYFRYFICINQCLSGIERDGADHDRL